MKKTFVLIIGGFLLLACASSSAFAWGWARSLPSRHEVIVVRGDRYHFNGGHFYKPGPVGFFMVAPPIGAYVTFLPTGYRTTIYGGISYYNYDNVYYSRAQSGYVVVPAPVENTTVVYTPEEPQIPVTKETVIINVPNSNGSYTPVSLTKTNNGYVGPQGEYYPGHPTLDQLKALYGK